MGIITVPSTGNISYSGYKTDSGTVGTSTSGGSIGYSVASNGRVPLTGATGGEPLLYLVSANEAFVLFTDNNVESGFVEPQSGSSFSNSSANGTFAFGTIWPGDPAVDLNVGVATFNGAGTITSVTSDDNSLGSGGSLNPGNTQTNQTYSIDSNGIGHLPAGCSIVTPSPTCDSIFILISSSKAAFMDMNSTTPNPSIQTVGK